MAIAERKEAVTELRVIEAAVVRLSLSDAEATFLVDVLANVGGNAAYTRRKYSDAISAALYRAGVRGLPRNDYGYVPDISKSQGAIYFEQV
ncbi:hypothetical protein DF152_17210 [Burkholderia cenocepacia]|nr:hypothetical protein DF152_17210 [Burkholderia cenocepacia]